MNDRERIDAEDWRRADAVFDRLLDLPREQWQALIAEQPEPVRVALQRLVDAHEGSGPLDSAMSASPLAGAVPEHIGGWQRGEEIGRGGMSVVYRAERRLGDAVQVAALKLLTVSALAADGRRHLQREHQALARLQHPRIVPLLDAGVLDDGTPYLAMPLVEGERIDCFCAERRLSVEQIVDLFRQVCEAVAYAHRRLVIHRDLKPGNILVDAGGHVQLLDFGIARLLDNGIDAEATATHLRALTPQYAAPEQFSGEGSGTAVDVFGLGAVLYQLLTGRPPRLSANERHETLTLPSRAVARNDALNATKRQALSRQLHGDLDAILMKALEDDPERRYPDAAAFDADLRRWQLRRPVRAVRAGALYRARKFAQRHRGAVAVTSLLVLAILGGLAGTLWQATRAEKAARAAQAQAERAEAVSHYLRSVLNELVPSTPEMVAPEKSVIVGRALDRARTELASRPEVLADVEQTLSRIDARLGNYARALEAAESAYRIRLDTEGGDSLSTVMAGIVLADMLRASPQRNPERDAQRLDDLYRHALEVATVPPAMPEQRMDVLTSAAYYQSSEHHSDQALKLLDEARLLVDGVADGAILRARVDFERARQLMRLDRFDDAVALYREVLPLYERLVGPEHADTADLLQEYAAALVRKDDPETAIDLLERARRINAAVYARPTEATMLANAHLVRAYQSAGRLDDAIALGEQNVDNIAQLMGAESNDVAIAQHELALVFLQAGRAEDALAREREAERIYRLRRGDDSPQVAITRASIGAQLLALDRLDEAGHLLEETTIRYAELFGPESSRMGSALTQFGKLRMKQRHSQEAAGIFQRAAGIYAATYGADHRWTLAVLALEAAALRDAGDLDKAEALARKAMDDLGDKAGEPSGQVLAVQKVLAEIACQREREDCPSRVGDALATCHAVYGPDHATCTGISEQGPAR